MQFNKKYNKVFQKSYLNYIKIKKINAIIYNKTGFFSNYIIKIK